MTDSTISYTVSLNATEEQAMRYVAMNPQEWVDNAVKNRARIAIDEIVALYTKRALDEGVQIPTTRGDIVKDAYAREWVMSAQKREELNPNTP